MSPRSEYRTQILSAFSLVWLWLVYLGICGSFLGCGPKAYVPTGEEAENLRQLAFSYMRYTGQHNGQSPPSEEKFKQFIVGQGYDKAKADNMFVSPRDGKPYVVSYNVPITGSTAVVIAYEQDGVEGTRYVAFDFGGVEMADEASFRQLVPNAMETD